MTTAARPGVPAAPPATQLSRRHALLIWLGRADRVALERDQLSALEGAGAYLRIDPSSDHPAEDEAAPAPPEPGVLGRVRARAASLIATFLRPRG